MLCLRTGVRMSVAPLAGASQWVQLKGNKLAVCASIVSHRRTMLSHTQHALHVCHPAVLTRVCRDCRHVQGTPPCAPRGASCTSGCEYQALARPALRL